MNRATLLSNVLFLEAEKLVDATNLLSEQLKKIMELDEFKKDIAKKLTVMETRLDRKYRNEK